jgi:hypothetical protein
MSDAMDGAAVTDTYEPGDPSASVSAKPGRFSFDWWEARNNTGRCKAHRKNGDRCKRPVDPGAAVCGHHGARAPAVRAKARQRIEEAADRMAKLLLKMASDENVSEVVRLRAITDALSRAGITEKTALEVEVSLKPYEKIMSDLTALETGSRADYRRSRGIAEETEPVALADRTRSLDGSDSDSILDAEVIESDSGEELLRKMRAYSDRDHDDEPVTYDDPDIVSTAHLAGIPTPPGSALRPVEEANEIAAEMRVRAAQLRPARPPQWALPPGRSR